MGEVKIIIKPADILCLGCGLMIKPEEFNGKCPRCGMSKFLGRQQPTSKEGGLVTNND